MMADIETNVIISAQIDGLRSGMEAAANSVQAATDAMRAQLAGLGDIAQEAQSQLTAATGQIDGGIGALQTKAASLAGSMGAEMLPNSGPGDAGGRGASSPIPLSAISKTPRPMKGCGQTSCSLIRNFRTTSKD
jgi:hypothetical protein